MDAHEAAGHGRRNDDIPWDDWPVDDYLAENYLELHDADRAVIAHHSAYLRDVPAGSVEESLEFGGGPNLYPLMLVAAACRRVHVVERSAANVRYLRAQLSEGAGAHWEPFWRWCRECNPALPARIGQALSRVVVTCGDATGVDRGRYGLASMNFVAEGATEVPAEFAAMCEAFVGAVRPGGHLLASFMENMGWYSIGGGRRWPACPVDSAAVRAVFAPLVRGLRIERIDADPTLPDWGYTGMLLLSGRRA